MWPNSIALEAFNYAGYYNGLALRVNANVRF